MISEKERLNALKEKIIQYENELEEKNSIINQYQAVEKAADNKIKALNTIHAEKVRSLMNSIALLKKEAQSLKKANQEHKRSELINNLNKEIGDQDLIIETLRNMLPNQEAADKAIVFALTKGPPKIRVETREELRMEIKKLKAQIAKLTTKQDNQAGSTDQKPANEPNLERRNSTDTQISVRTEFNENFFQQIDLLKKENEDLALNLKAQQVVIQRYEEENDEKMKELNELRLIKTDFTVLTKKYEALQKEYEKIKEANNKKFVMTYDKEMRLEELEIINKTQQGKMNLVEKNMGFELVNYRQRVQDLEKKNIDLEGENEKVLLKYNDMLQRSRTLNESLKKTREEFDAFRKEKEQLISLKEVALQSLRASLDKMEQEKNDFETEAANLNNKLYTVKGELSKTREENIYLNQKLKELNEKLISFGRFAEENKEVEPIIETTKNLGQSVPDRIPKKQSSQENSNLAAPSKEMLQENTLLKKKLKELMIQQIELSERSEALEMEVRLRGRKESNAFIKARQHERQVQKLQNMQEQIKRGSTFLRMDSNISQHSKAMENSKMTDSNLSISQSFSKMDSKISTPIRSEGLIETDSDISSENLELRKAIRQKQEEDLNLKTKVDSLEKEFKNKTGKEYKKDLNFIENERKIKELGEKISNISLNNSDVSRGNSVGNSILNSSLSNLDSNLDSIVSQERKDEQIDTDSNISGFSVKK